MTIPALAHRSLHEEARSSNRAGTIVLWLTAAFAALLLAASLTGNGTGLLRTGLFAGMLWLWVFLPVIIAAIFWGLLLHRRALEAEMAPGPRKDA